MGSVNLFSDELTEEVYTTPAQVSTKDVLQSLKKVLAFLKFVLTLVASVELKSLFSRPHLTASPTAYLPHPRHPIASDDVLNKSTVNRPEATQSEGNAEKRNHFSL